MSDLAKSIGKPIGIALGVVLVGGLVWLVFGARIKGALGAVGDAVNPTSDKNLAYRGVNSIGSAVTGNGSWSLGSAIYDLFHAEYDPNAKPATADEASWWDNLTSKISGG